MPAIALLVSASALVGIGKSIAVPVVVAVLTAIGTVLITRASDAANRRRDRYAQAVETLVAWAEFPYRVRRRTDDDSATLAGLATMGHDLQERLACHQVWIATEHPALARIYAQTREIVSAVVSPAVTEAWESAPISKPADMNLGEWGPGTTSAIAIARLQPHIENRFGFRRLGRGLRAWNPWESRSGSSSAGQART